MKARRHEGTKARRAWRGSSQLHGAVGFLLLLILAPVLADDATTQPALETEAIRNVLKMQGIIEHDVLSFAVPRDDLHVVIDGMPVPTEAGIGSRICFYRCPCGRTRMTGELVVCDYEVDDVIAAMHAQEPGYADVRIDAVSPMFSEEKPALRIVRVHGEGDAEALANRVSAAFGCMGDARNQKSTTMPSTNGK